MKQKLDDLAAGRLVKIAGRLVGHEDRRIRRDRARKRHALLLAAGELRRIVRQPAAKTDGDQLALGAAEGVVHAGQFERHGDILQRRHGRDEMEGLKDNADMFAAKARQRVLAELAQIFAGTDDRAGVGRSSPVITISSVDLPEPDGPSSATASPRPILRSMSRRMWTRAAPPPSDRLTPRSAMAAPPKGSPNVSCMSSTERPAPSLAWQIIWVAAILRMHCATSCVRLFVALRFSLRLLAGHRAGAMRETAAKPIKIVALGDSLTAGLGLPESEGFVPRLQAALAAKGLPRGRSMPASPATPPRMPWRGSIGRCRTTPMR